MAPCSPAVGCYQGYVVVVNGTVIGSFLGLEDAERAYRAARGELAASAPGYAEVTLDCSHGQGAPVNGGCAAPDAASIAGRGFQ